MIPTEYNQKLITPYEFPVQPNESHESHVVNLVRKWVLANQRREWCFLMLGKKFVQSEP